MGFFDDVMKPPSAEVRRLKEVLFSKYEGFADKRSKNIDKGELFIIDGRGRSDCGADKKLFGWFCTMFAEVIDGKTVKVTLGGGVPRSQSVDRWIRDYGVEQGHGLTFNVTPSDLAKLPQLAAAFRTIVRPGARYGVRAYKYVCPRTAAALDELHAVLAAHWGKKA
jgi:hypothetical protein